MKNAKKTTTDYTFNCFTFLGSILISEEKYKNFDELIEFLDDKIYATLKETSLFFYAKAAMATKVKSFQDFIVFF